MASKFSKREKEKVTFSRKLFELQEDSPKGSRIVGTYRINLFLVVVHRYWVSILPLPMSR